MQSEAIAVFSDIHSNLEALQAVIADMDAFGVNRRICLGDIVGYAANPSRCLDLVWSMGCPVLKGNHDVASAGNFPLFGMRPVAQIGVQYSRAKLSPAQKVYLNDLPMELTQWGCQFVHASLEAPEEWIYILDGHDAARHFYRQKAPICFCGHTHRPMVWERGAGWFVDGYDGSGWMPLGKEEKILINVGSVGQPRDDNPHACYALYFPAEHAVEFRRIPYDIATTQRKIAAAKLPPFLSKRLEQGR